MIPYVVVERPRTTRLIPTAEEEWSREGNALRASAPQTVAIRTGHFRSREGEHSEPVYETSSYVYGSSSESALVFSGAIRGNVYSRFTNPTVRILEERLAALELTDAAVGTASGMAAILAICVTFLSAGDHVVCSKAVFGSTAVLLRNFFAKFGVTISFVSQCDIGEWAAAIQPTTRFLFCETPSNPMLEVVDLRRLSKVAHDANVLLIVDNTFCTPVGQRPIALGADLIVHSVSKYIDGQGRCIGGAIAGRQELIDKLTGFMRSAGPAMSAHNAWIFLKGLETLELRMREHSRSAHSVARWLAEQPMVDRVFYTGLRSHPQHDLACAQQRLHGGVLSFQIKGSRREAWRCIDSLKMISLTTNVGDTKTMITHPATTTHTRMSPEDRLSLGITDGLIRLTVGLESIEDIVADLDTGLRAV